MKNLAFILVLGISFTYMANAANDAENPFGIRTWNADRDFGTSIKQGKLVFQTVDLKSGTLGSYVYQTNAGKWILLSGRLNGINEFFADAVGKESAREFLDKQVAQLLLATMAPFGSRIIDSGLLTFYETHGDTASISTLRRYKSDVKPVIDPSGWVLEFNVAAENGGIEHWRARGSLVPLSVQSFSRDIVEPGGAYVPRSETGGTPH
jgi:hypothetical protein